MAENAMGNRIIMNVMLLMFASPVFAASYTLETSVITDWETVTYYGGSVVETEEAIDTIVEYAENIFSEQLDINLQVTYIEIPQSESADRIANHTHAEFLMDSVHSYRIEEPEHYEADVTVFFSVRDLAIGNTDYAGYANIKSVCSSRSIALVEITNNGLDGQTLAHELAHVIGAVHDGDEPCENTSSTGYLMSPVVHSGNDYLSQCSVETVDTTLELYGQCLTESASAPIVPVSTPPTVESSGGGGSSGFLFLCFLIIIMTGKFSRKSA